MRSHDPAPDPRFERGPHAPRRAIRSTLMLLLAAIPVAATANADTCTLGTRAGGKGEFEYLFIEKGGDSCVSDTRHDWGPVLRMARTSAVELFAFAIGDRMWVVREPQFVERVRQIVEPLVAFGRRQAGLGAQQARLGARQAALGERMAEIGRRMGALGERLGRLAFSAASYGNHESAERTREALERRIEVLRERHGALEEEGASLTRRQRELARQHELASREHARVSVRVGAELDRCAREAMRSGEAEAID